MHLKYNQYIEQPEAGFNEFPLYLSCTEDDFLRTMLDELSVRALGGITAYIYKEAFPQEALFPYYCVAFFVMKDESFPEIRAVVFTNFGTCSTFVAAMNVHSTSKEAGRFLLHMLVHKNCGVTFEHEESVPPNYA